MSRIGIAGAGVAGRLLAFQLARLGHEVEVYDIASDAAAQAHATLDAVRVDGSSLIKRTSLGKPFVPIYDAEDE